MTRLACSSCRTEACFNGVLYCEEYRSATFIDLDAPADYPFPPVAVLQEPPC